MFLAGFIFFLLIAFAFFLKSIKIVQQANTLVIERLGKYNRTLDSGVNFLIPFIDKPRKIKWRYIAQDLQGNRIIKKLEIDRIDLRETVYDFPKQNVITKDNVTITIDALLYFQVTDPMKSVYEISNLPDAIEKLAQTTLRNVIGELDLDQTLTSRDTINSKLRAILDDATDKWGVKVNRVELQDIAPPSDIKNAMEKQMRAERDRRAIILEAEGSKTAAILTAEGEKNAEIERAEGQKRATILTAQGEAEARLLVAEAEAQAIRKISETIKESNGDPAQYLLAIKYIEAFSNMGDGKNSKIIYIPYENSGIMSSIGMIKDMFKE